MEITKSEMKTKQNKTHTLTGIHSKLDTEEEKDSKIMTQWQKVSEMKHRKQKTKGKMNTAPVTCGFKWHVTGVPEVESREWDTEKKSLKK